MKVAKDVIGLLIKATIKEDGVVVDISSATTKKIKIKSPSGSVKIKDASFLTDGQDGVLTYTTVADDLDEKGIWKIQAYLELSNGFQGHTFVDDFIVEANLS